MLTVNRLFVSGAVLMLSLVGCALSSGGSGGQLYRERMLMLDNGQYSVPGILAVPRRSAGEKAPVVVMLHGTASQKNEVGGLYQRLAAALAERGYASLRIDFAGTGDSPVDYREYNLSSAERDARTALDYLAEQEQFDAGRMGLIGFSQGGLMAQRVAAHDGRVRALATWSSVAENGPGIFEDYFGRYYEEAQNNGFAIVDFPWREEPLYFGLQWFEEIKNHTTLDDMPHYHGKLLAVAGTADPLVPYVSSLSLVEAAGSDSAAVHLVKGADHMFNVLGDADSNGLARDQSTAEEVLKVTADWFARNL